MIRLLKSDDRGQTHIDWLKSWHSFSFGDYHNPDYVHFHSLRVLNEDIVAPGGGFPPHGHRNMEIVTYILEGALEHQDSLGNGSVIHPGDVQRMSAGSGIRHSEFNHSKEKPVHLLQIWFLPAREELKPEYEQKHFSRKERQNRLRLVGSPDGREGSVRIHQDILMYAGILDKNATVQYVIAPRRHVWMQVANGSITLNDAALKTGDGAALSEEKQLQIAAVAASEVILFDMG